jgi:hypothetical protein
VNAQPERPEYPGETAPEEGQTAVYALTLRGHLGSQWAEWFDGATIALHDNGDTVLTCPVADQAALHGLLKRVRDLGMPLISVACIEPNEKETNT